MTKIRLTTAVVVLALLALTGCKDTKGSGGGSSAPQPSDTCGGYNWCTSAAGGGGVVATADAGPVVGQTAEGTGGSDCKFYYYPDSSGLATDNHTLIIGTVKVSCDPVPKSLSVAVTIYRLADLSKHYAAVGVGGATLPGPALTAPITAHAPCLGGVYYLEMYATGVSAGNNPFSAHVIGRSTSPDPDDCV